MEEKSTFKKADKKSKKNFILTIVVMAIFLFLMLSGNMLNGDAARIEDHFLKVGEKIEIEGEYSIEIVDVKCIKDRLPKDEIKDVLLNDKLEPLFVAVLAYDCRDLSGAGRGALVIQSAGTAKEDGHLIPSELISDRTGQAASSNTSAFVFYYEEDIVQFKFSFTDSENVLHNVYITSDIVM